MTQRTAQDRPETTTTRGVLDPAFRQASLEELRRAGTDVDAELDLLIIGGGVVGAGAAAAPVVAGLMAPLLGWSEAQAEREVAFYQARVAAERASQEQPDDESADETRLNVEDIVPVRD